MLRRLHISNYALIEQLDIDFSDGFSVITGETGAGKSIMMGALALLLGARADAKVIKLGASKCCVEAEFEVAKLNIASLFEATGKSRAFVNDSPVTLQVLKEIASRIIDVHSQHQNLLMGDENFVLGILDAVSADATPKVLYAEAFGAWREAQKEYLALKEKAEKDQHDSEYLQFQLQQLEEAGLKEGEQEALEEELEILSHAEEIKQALYKVSSGFQSEGNNPISFLRSSIQTLRRIDSVFPIAGSLAERLDSVQIELEDVSGELESSLERVEYDPKRQEVVDERLNLLYSLQRKHNVQSEKELLALMESLRERVDTIENIGDVLLQKEKEVCRLSEEMNKLGEQLTALRKEAAKIIEARLVECLHSLGMPSVLVAMNLSLRPSPDVTGLDNVDFLFSANKNVPMQEVAKIASGGEIARLMLALKSIISHVRHLPTIVFDEIDTGVSGTMAEKMALVMQDMASDCQVLCITHLPQIAALGRWHYRVSKQETSNGTTSRIERLTEEERVLEIANMLSGEQLTDAAINNAKSLLKYDK